MFGSRYQIPMVMSAAVAADTTQAIGRAEGAMVIQSADVFCRAAIATHATNYVVMNLINLGTAGTGTTVIATASTSQTTGAAVVANKAFPLTITAANASIADGEAIGFVWDESSTDVADATVTVVVRYLQVGEP